MKKFLFAAPITALILCLTLEPSHGMKREREEDTNPAFTTCKSPSDDNSQTTAVKEEEEYRPLSLHEISQFPKDKITQNFRSEQLLYTFYEIIAARLDSDHIVNKTLNFRSNPPFYEISDACLNSAHALNERQTLQLRLVSRNWKKAIPNQNESVGLSRWKLSFMRSVDPIAI